MKPSTRIMEIYTKEANDYGSSRLSAMGEGLPAFLQKMYCDSICAYLDEQAEKEGSK